MADTFPRSISIGHGQKLVSILLKYAFVAAHSGSHGLPGEFSALVRSCPQKFPVPIDAIVLFHLKMSDGANSGDIRAYRRPNADGEFTHTAFVVPVGEVHCSPVASAHGVHCHTFGLSSMVVPSFPKSLLLNPRALAQALMAASEV